MDEEKIFMDFICLRLKRLKLYVLSIDSKFRNRFELVRL